MAVLVAFNAREGAGRHGGGLGDSFRIRPTFRVPRKAPRLAFALDRPSPPTFRARCSVERFGREAHQPPGTRTAESARPPPPECPPAWSSWSRTQNPSTGQRPLVRPEVKPQPF